MRSLILVLLISCATVSEQPIENEIDPLGLRSFQSPDSAFICGSPVLKQESQFLPYGITVCRWVKQIPNGDWAVMCPPPTSCRVRWRGRDFPPSPG